MHVRERSHYFQLVADTSQLQQRERERERERELQLRHFCSLNTSEQTYLYITSRLLREGKDRKDTLDHFHPKIQLPPSINRDKMVGHPFKTLLERLLNQYSTSAMRSFLPDANRFQISDGSSKRSVLYYFEVRGKRQHLALGPNGSRSFLLNKKV